MTVLNGDTFASIVTKKDRKKEISEIKFSPDNRVCAVGAHDQTIITYDVNNKFKMLKKMRGHSSTILHVQFSLDSQYLLSTCKAYEILFFNVSDGKQYTSGASGTKDEPWADWSSPLGWPVQGIFPPCADGSDINAVDRSADHQTLATADDFGMVKLFRFPCPVDEAAYVKYNGHSAHVTNVKFSKGGDYLISTGGGDLSVFQWRFNNQEDVKQEEKNKGDAPVDTSALKADMDNDDDDDMFGEEEDMGEGD